MFDKIMKKVVTLEQLGSIRTKHQDNKISFCTGCYDILQPGHAVFFSQCKELGDILVVGVGSDSVISKLKGPGRPVNPENNRVHLVAALDEVDFAIINSRNIIGEKIDFLEILKALKPDSFVLNDDDSDIASKRKICDELGISLKLVPRTVPQVLSATSTTSIIDKINFSFKAPLRIDFAGGWTDVPFIMKGTTGYVTNAAIKPHIELKSGAFNFSGYPRGSGLSTSTAVKLLEMISAKNYGAESKSVSTIAEDLFNLENKELNWAIGRQDQYIIASGGVQCYEFGSGYCRSRGDLIEKATLEEFHQNLLLLHTCVSRNAQVAVEQVYKNHQSESGKAALLELASYGKEFYQALSAKDYVRCAEIMEKNFIAQKKLAPASSNELLDEIYAFAKENGAMGGKICGAGGGGAFLFYCQDRNILKKKIKKKFTDCFEIDFEFEFRNIKQLNNL